MIYRRRSCGVLAHEALRRPLIGVRSRWPRTGATLTGARGPRGNAGRRGLPGDGSPGQARLAMVRRDVRAATVIRRVARASEMLDRLLDTTAEPVILNVLHRRIRELLEVADRVAAGEALPAIGRTMKISSEFRMRNLAAQARAWTVADLHAALDGLLELDAMVKGAPGSTADPAQRRLAFLLWVAERVGR